MCVRSTTNESQVTRTLARLFFESWQQQKKTVFGITTLFFWASEPASIPPVTVTLTTPGFVLRLRWVDGLPPCSAVFLYF